MVKKPMMADNDLLTGRALGLLSTESSSMESKGRTGQRRRTFALHGSGQHVTMAE
jgi:hypothetical protein